MPKVKRSVEEIKQDLKQEIIRLGIQDNPSRTVYQKEYQRGVAPSPNGALKATGMKWQELMSELGFEYDGKKNISNNAKKESAKLSMRREKGLRLTNPDNLRYIVNESLKLINEKKITDAVTFEEMVNLNLDTTYQTLSKHGYSFEKFKELYAEKYGHKIRSGKWGDKSNIELFNMAAEYMKKNNLTNLRQYDTSINRDAMPSSRVLTRRLGLSYPELSQQLKSVLD